MYSKISILLPTFNAGDDLYLAVKSILNQSFKNWTLSILDDGSTDNSLEKINNLSDERIKIFKNKINKGVSYRLNQGIKLSETKYIARMDADDISFPERLEKQFNFLEENNDIDLVSCRVFEFSDSTYHINRFLPYKEFHSSIVKFPWKTILMPHPTWMGRTKWFKKNLYKTPPHKIPPVIFTEDQELLLRSMTTSKFYSLPDILLAYRGKKKFFFYKTIAFRISLLTVQVNFFIKKKKFIYFFLAINFFFLKVIIDFIKIISNFLKINLIKNYKEKKRSIDNKLNIKFKSLVNYLKKIKYD